MIDKTALKELIEDNCQWGDYEDETFYIVPSWSIIEEANKLQGITGHSVRTCSRCGELSDTPGCDYDGKYSELGGHHSPYYVRNETDPERRYICLQLAFFYFRESNQIKPWTRRAKTDFIRLIRSRSIISANVS